MSFDHALSLGAIGATGTRGANVLAREADLVIGIGTRYSDFTTASKTAFQNPNVRFVNINVGEFDAFKHGGVAVVADARETLVALLEALPGFLAPAEWRARAGEANRDWDKEVERIYTIGSPTRPSQGEVIGAVNDAAGERGVRGVRRGQPSRRPAQAVALARPQELSPRIRLLLHGLRSRGRHGGQDGGARSGGVRDGGRRLVAHDVVRDRDRESGRA